MNKLTEKFFSVLKIPTSSGEIMTTSSKHNSPQNKIISLLIIGASLGITYLPIFPVKTNVTIVSGSELKEVLEEISDKFEKDNPHIDLEIEIQGSQDIISNVIDKKNDFIPTVLIPANSELITELETTLKAQGETDIFYYPPEAIARTLLVAIAWEERGKVLFPNNKFSWNQLEKALKTRNWQQLGGDKNWGSFDFVTTDPTRSNSGQLTLSLWAKNDLNQNILTVNDINNNRIRDLFTLIKKSVYQPPRSTDILLQEFIARGANDADVATVYESIALHRWSQAKERRNQSYQIYYPNPTIETTITGAILKQNVSKQEAKSAEKFINYLKQKEQQIILAKYGFRPIIDLDLENLKDTPWSENIEGVEIEPSISIKPSPDNNVINEIEKIWNQAN
ncbi:substrate-binding domain-containing protein [Cyanobacterium sp. Dongsha4]|uniref:substrate-binding domain-containing protein n=1 Tax=Cyanobacterium sp. DS4 TaxID=2878255 RepID=UPI002E8204A7|nr:substrate-binding domain-containing protein [Cyanobacterium sp. Dongsha4]WVL01128.1 substrate-binding domain-containing protein [Cyanobacterium sp. Dongsha4]